MGRLMQIYQHKHVQASSQERVVVPKHRNSSIELLRIISMLMITAHHYVLFGFPAGSTQPPFTFKWFFFLLIKSLGKIGVTIFFAISAWYLCMEKKPTLRANLKRIWLLEREVLFYSLSLLAFCLVLIPYPIPKGTILQSFAPTVTSLWWYITAYVMFLFFAPFLTMGLRKIGKSGHATLCLLLLVVWGVFAGMLPGGLLSTSIENYTTFIYLYILISFYRWYLDDWNAGTAWLCVGIGLLLIALSIVVLQISGTYLHIETLRVHSNYLSISSFQLPVLLVGFGVIILVEKTSFYSKIINLFASTTLAVYLIQEYPIMREVLWRNQFGLFEIYNKPNMLAKAAGYVLAIFFIFMFVDLFRQALFVFTVDKHPARWFDTLSHFIATRHCVLRMKQRIKEKPIPHEDLILGNMLIDQADNPIPPTVPSRKD